MSRTALTDRNAARHCRWSSPSDGIDRVAAAHPPSEKAYTASCGPHSNRAATFLAYRTDLLHPMRLHPLGSINHSAPVKSP